ncbi:MAG: SCP2 sterol-binding domain-containing protein [Thermoanaerobaculia bacterium]
MTPDASSFDSASPTPELFGPAWVERFERELGASEPFRIAAAKWKGSVALSLVPDATAGFGAARGVFLDLAHGSARAVRAALPGDLATANFCLEAPAAVWIRMLSGELEPGPAIMGGGLKLTRGSLFSLLPHIQAAQALLHCARLVPIFLPPSGR